MPPTRSVVVAMWRAGASEVDSADSRAGTLMSGGAIPNRQVVVVDVCTQRDPVLIHERIGERAMDLALLLKKQKKKSVGGLDG